MAKGRLGTNDSICREHRRLTSGRIDIVSEHRIYIYIFTPYSVGDHIGWEITHYFRMLVGRPFQSDETRYQQKSGLSLLFLGFRINEELEY